MSLVIFISLLRPEVENELENQKTSSAKRHYKKSKRQHTAPFFQMVTLNKSVVEEAVVAYVTTYSSTSSTCRLIWLEVQ